MEAQVGDVLGLPTETASGSSSESDISHVVALSAADISSVRRWTELMLCFVSGFF